MVNGKPTLTFGDNQYTTPAKNQQRPDDAKVRNTKALKGFASYLPVTESASQAKARPKQTTPAAAQAFAPAVLQTHTESRRSGAMPAAASAVTMPVYQPAGIQTPLAGYRDGNLPGGAGLAGAGQQNAALRSPQALQYALPPGSNSRAAAREYAQSSLENFQGNISPGATAARLSQKNMPSIPSRTVPGRYGFGMVDTRKIPADPGALQAQTRNASQNIDKGYTGYAGNTAGGQGEKSFVTHGFGGGNAAFALRSLGYNIRESQPDRTYARRLDSDSGIVMGPSGQVLGRSRSMAVDGGEDAARMSAMPGSQGRKSGDLGPAFSYPGRSLIHSLYNINVDNSFGSLAAKFESGAEGISAIGFDRKGGTSYGKYQIASRVGTMAAFIDYLDEKAPDFAKRLRSAGPANTGGRSGKMPAEWRKIASEDPVRFEKLQEDFIRTSHFEPAMRSITESTGLGFANMPAALQEVLFSTAVQHGPLGAVRIFNQALSSVGINKLQTTGKLVTESFKRAGRQLIKQVYALRAGQFMASSSGVQASVRNRLHQEMNEALGMLV